MDRKSPYRHPVRKYRRKNGTSVDRYMRGEGKRPREASRVIGSASVGGARWRVSSAGASVTVPGGDIVQGLRRGVDGLAKTGETVTVNKVN